MDDPTRNKMTWGKWPERETSTKEATESTRKPNRPLYQPRTGRRGGFSSTTTVTNIARCESSSANSSYKPSSSSHIPNSIRFGPNRIGTPSVYPPQNLEDYPFHECGDAVTENGGINFDAYEDIPVEASGEDVPPHVDAFEDLDLGFGLSRNIELCRYVRPTPIQRHALPIAIAGRDLMACAQTGSGKTAAFCFPIISGVLKNRDAVDSGGAWNMASPVALILSPTRELASQIHEEAKKFAFQTGAKIVVAYGGAPVSQQLRELNRGVDILVATPGRLVDMVERGRISLQMIKYLTVDEADRMLDMGFEPQIRKIVEGSGMPPPGVRQTMLFSATFPDEIQRLASDFMSNYIFLTVGRIGSSIDLIQQKVEFVEAMNKRDHLMDLLCAQNPNGVHGKLGLTIIFVETKRGVDSLEHWLLRNGFHAAAIHGDKQQMEREQALRSFKNGYCPILVATDVAARGLDIPHVAHVINFDLPRNIDDYVHRIGRTGRAGKSGLATALFTESNMPLAKSLVELMKEAKQEVPSWLTDFAEPNSHGGIEQDGPSRVKKFGGSDFRKGRKFGNGICDNDSRNYGKGESYRNYSSNYGDVASYTNTNSDRHVDSGLLSYPSANNTGDINSSTADFYNNSSYWNADSSVEPYNSANNIGEENIANADGWAVPSNYNSYAAPGSQEYQLGCDSIVATGWD